MNKSKLDQRYSPYTMPCVIIGAIVDNKANFMLCTWISRVNRNPPLWMVSINKKHYTINGIKKNKIFSVNVPSVDLAIKSDYIGITSGREKDKSSLFNIFYGELKVPMIEECVLNIEFKVQDLIELPDHFIVLGTALNSYIDNKYQEDGKLDMKKINPIIYTGVKEQPTYWSLGEKLGDAFKLGKQFKI